MSLQTIGRKLVELCNQGKNFDLMRTMYTPDIVSVEGGGEEAAGQAEVIRKSEIWQANNNIHSQKVRGRSSTEPTTSPLGSSRSFLSLSFGRGLNRFAEPTAIAATSISSVSQFAGSLGSRPFASAREGTGGTWCGRCPHRPWRT